MIVVEHPCPQEHPYRLEEVPPDLRKAWAADNHSDRCPCQSDARTRRKDRSQLVDSLAPKEDPA